MLRACAWTCAWCRQRWRRRGRQGAARPCRLQCFRLLCVRSGLLVWVPMVWGWRSGAGWGGAAAVARWHPAVSASEPPPGRWGGSSGCGFKTNSQRNPLELRTRSVHPDNPRWPAHRAAPGSGNGLAATRRHSANPLSRAGKLRSRLTQRCSVCSRQVHRSVSRLRLRLQVHDRDDFRENH